MVNTERNLGKYIVQSGTDSEIGYEQCIEEYIHYYDSRSKKYKNIYFFWNTVKLVAIVCIPIGEILLKGMTDTNWIVIGASSITIFCESILEKLKARDKYLTYRSTCDRLMSEQRMYKTKCGYYKDKKDMLNEYVKRIESIIETEGGTWKEYMKAEEMQEK